MSAARADAPHRRRAVAAVVLVLPAAVALTSGSTAAHDPEVPVLDWVDCGDGFQCATAEVPLDHDRPRRGSIELALTRRPAAWSAALDYLYGLTPPAVGTTCIDTRNPFVG